jgi:two-component sensor histidine kinase
MTLNGIGPKNISSMMRDMSHRVKNSLTLVTGRLALQARGTDIADVKRAVTDAETLVATIAAMHDHLWRNLISNQSISPSSSKACAGVLRKHLISMWSCSMALHA